MIYLINIILYVKRYNKIVIKILSLNRNDISKKQNMLFICLTLEDIFLNP